MSKYISAVIALLVILALCTVEGIWTGRFGEYKSEMLDHFVQCIENTPLNFEDWEGSDNDKTKDIVLQEAGAIGHLSRTYRNHAIGEAVSLYYICGSSQKVAIHAPTACYPGSGYTQEGEVKKYSFSYPYINKENGTKYLREAEFFTTVFSRGTERVRVFWSWNDGTRWEAPTMPRSRYSGLIPLNKCYLIVTEAKGDSRDPKLSDRAVNHFARLFLSYVDDKMLKDGKLPFGDMDVKLGDPIDINAKIEYDTPEEGAQESADDESNESNASNATRTVPAPETEGGLPILEGSSSGKAAPSGDLPSLNGGTNAPEKSIKTLDQTLPGIEAAVTPSSNVTEVNALPGL